ncbi:MAG: SLC13 family permease [Planctomycetota bacterium]|nr:SLC13 family permease [Planctomycetota bacterium]
MTPERWLLAGLLVTTLGFFLWGRYRHDLVAVMALVVAALTGLVPADRAFEGFGHPAVVTVAAVLVVSAALAASGVVELATRPVQRLTHRPIALLAGLTLTVTVLSAFINNVGALALLMPVAIRLAHESGRSPSLFLMPLAFGSLLGGMTTLIGTPPNLIVSGFREKALGEAFGLFDFAPVGGLVAIGGVLFLVLWGWRLVPQRKSRVGSAELMKVGPYLTEVRVGEGSSAAGKTLAALHMEDVQVLAIVRDKTRIPAPGARRVLRAGDLLVLMGESRAIEKLMGSRQLDLLGHDDQAATALLEGDDTVLVEAVVRPRARMLGQTAIGLNLRRRHGINLLGIAREGARLKGRLAHTRLKAGDVLLLQGAREGLFAELNELGCLPLAERRLTLGQRKKQRSAIGVFLACLGLVAAGLVPAPIAFVAAAALMVVLNVLPLRDAYSAVDWPVIVLLGALIPVGMAIETTGLAGLIAEATIALGQVAPGWVVLGVILIASMFLSDLINNAAAAVMMCPIALAAAQGLDANPDPFLLAVAIGASCAFLTPVGHQSNLLVMGPGGYRFGDYWRIGLALEALIVAIAVPALAFFWPL